MVESRSGGRDGMAKVGSGVRGFRPVAHGDGEHRRELLAPRFVRLRDALEPGRDRLLRAAKVVRELPLRDPSLRSDDRIQCAGCPGELGHVRVVQRQLYKRNNWCDL